MESAAVLKDISELCLFYTKNWRKAYKTKSQIERVLHIKYIKKLWNKKTINISKKVNRAYAAANGK